MKKKNLIFALTVLEERTYNNAKLVGMLEVNLNELALDIAKLRQAIEKAK